MYEDFADNDVSMGPDGAYYFSASNMHYSPGAPLLKSWDLVNWELIGHSVPFLDFGDGYNLTNGQREYRGGTWASTMRYRPSNGLWYWIGCANFWYTYVYTAPNPEGPWTKAAQSEGGVCYYDCGLLIDDDDTMYVVYGATDVSIAQLTPNGLGQVRTQRVLGASDIGIDGIEGNRLYKRDGYYYVLNDHPGDTTYIWRSRNIWGPYTSQVLVRGIESPVPNGGAPHQGSLIRTPDDDWYYMSFTWAYPAGRMPVLAPVTWGSDGFPRLTTSSSGGWGATYPMPLPERSMASWTGTDTFSGSSLGPDWEWNHNPDPSRYSVSNGLTLRTATVTSDLYSARNTLTHRIHGEFPVGTIHLDFSGMADGDRAGLAAFRDQSAYIGISRSGNSYALSVVHGVTQDPDTWATTSTGQTVAQGPSLAGATQIWLRVSMDARASGNRQATFSYSRDGNSFVDLGPAYSLTTDWRYFMGYRFGIFNFATRALGGSVVVRSFTSA